MDNQISKALLRKKFSDIESPIGVPAEFGDHARLLYDLQILALQADITRVISFQFTRELNNRTYPQIGVPEPHHPTSHHGNDPVKVEKIAKIGQYHMTFFAEFLEKLKMISVIVFFLNQ